MVKRRSQHPQAARRREQPAPGRLGVARGVRRGEEGYNLVVLIVGFTIMNILAALALPLMSYTIRRDREEETIFRGLQYAEAVRVFRQRFGRYPATLDELVKVEPRSIRQLWNEPLTEDGEFGLVVEAPAPVPNAPGGAAGQPGAGAPTPPGQPVTVPTQGGGRTVAGGFGVGTGGAGGGVNLLKLPRVKAKDEGLVTVPRAIHGVYVDREGESLRKFLGQDKYEQWVFVAELITPPVTAPGRPLPSVRSDWIGKGFPEGFSPFAQPPLGPGGIPQGTPPGGTFQPGAQPPGVKPGEKPGEKPGWKPGEKKDSDDDAPAEFPEDFPEDFPQDVPEDFPEDLPQDEVMPEEEEPPAEEHPVDQLPDDSSDPGVDENPR